MVVETMEKRVHFTENDYLEPNINDLSHEEDDAPLLKSPLKATTGLGSTIKKLSPVSGAAQTDGAKRAYNRLLQEAAMSMFSNDDENIELAVIGKENKSNASGVTPDFYKVAADIATQNSHALNRLESQQYDLSPPMPRGLAPPAGTSNAPTTPISSSHRDFLAYREAHSATRSGDIHKQLQGLHKDFLRAQQGGISPEGAESKMEVAGTREVTKARAVLDHDHDDDDLDTNDAFTGVSTESSPATVAILNAHLNSIHFEAEPAVSYVDPADYSPRYYNLSNQGCDTQKISEFHDYNDSTTNKEFGCQGSSDDSDEVQKDAASEACTEDLTITASPKHSDGDATSDPHGVKSYDDSIAAACIGLMHVGQLFGMSIQEGEELLKQCSLFLCELENELSPRFTSLGTSDSDSTPTTIAHAIALQTYSMDALEASVLLKHEQLVAKGVITHS